MNTRKDTMPERIFASLFVGLLVTFFVALLETLGTQLPAPLWAYFALASLVAIIVLSIVERVE